MQVCHAPFSRFLPPSDGVTSGLILPTEMITTASSSDLHACNHTPTHYIRSEAARLITSHNCPTDHVTCTLLSKNTRSFPNVPALPLRVPPHPQSIFSCPRPTPSICCFPAAPWRSHAAKPTRRFWGPTHSSRRSSASSALQRAP